MENYLTTRGSLFMRRRVSMLVRLQTDQDDLRRRPGAFHSEGQLRKSEARWTCHRQHRAKSGRSDDDGILRQLEFCIQLYRRESDSGTTQGIGSDRRKGVDAGRIEENRDSLRADHP